MIEAGLFDGEGSLFEGICGTLVVYIIIAAMFLFFMLKFLNSRPLHLLHTRRGG